MSLQGKVAVITGGGRGIGAAIATAFAREGTRVVLAARTRRELEQVREMVRSHGGAAESVTADVSRPDDVARVMDTARRVFGNIDILVNAAGIYGPIGPLWEADIQRWIDALHVNLVGTFLCCRAAVPDMLRRRWGRIINLSGGGATAPLPAFSAYGVSKAAVVRLTETLAEEVRDAGITVNAIAPGAVDTRLQDEVLSAGSRAGPLADRIRRLRETGEGGVPPELAAELAVFLAGEDAGGLTGKLVAAPYDDWRSWTPEQIRELMAAPWLTLRRIDQHTVQPLFEKRR